MIKSSDVLAEYGFDPDALKRKYLEERDKRLRADGEDQYVDLEGRFADLAADPAAVTMVRHSDSPREVDVFILGGGMAGVLSAINLRREGVENFLIVEQGGDFGGTWYWNNYPGIRCDIESYVYIPMLEEAGTVPSEKYAHGSEIQAHFATLGRKFDLYERTWFGTVVSSIRWVDADARWEILTGAGDTIYAGHVLVSSGPLHRPKLPGIPGLGTFKGKAFHTSRWDYGYTGGDAFGNLTGLRGKRVALIGTGATGVQVMPHLAEAAEHLTIFQRTPSSVDRRNNRPTDVAWFAGQESGWQQKRIDNFVQTLTGIAVEEDLVNDCWTDNSKLLRLLEEAQSESIQNAPIADKLQLADYLKMQQLRRLAETEVNDPATAERLKPWYNLLCKRPLFSDEYYPTFNRDNVTLVDTDGKGVDRITEDAVVVEGVSYPVDCIIFATGFRVGAYSYKSGGYTLRGRGGVDMADRWAQGPRTVHGTKTAGFPNFHIVGTYTQASQSFSYSHVTMFQTAHAAKIVGKCLREGIRTFEVTETAEDKWQEALRAKRPPTEQFEAECTPGYFNNEGKQDGSASLLGGMYGGGPFEYIALLDEWIEQDLAEDSKLTYAERLPVG